MLGLQDLARLAAYLRTDHQSSRLLLRVVRFHTSVQYHRPLCIPTALCECYLILTTTYTVIIVLDSGMFNSHAAGACQCWTFALRWTLTATLESGF